MSLQVEDGETLEVDIEYEWKPPCLNPLVTLTLNVLAKWLPKDKCQAAEVPDHVTSVHTTEYEIEENSAKAGDVVAYISCSNLKHFYQY